jgi:hypothetical protein
VFGAKPVSKFSVKQDTVSIQHLCPIPAATCSKHARVLCVGFCVEIDEVGVLEAEEQELAGVETELDSGIPLLRLLYMESGYKELVLRAVKTRTIASTKH